MQKQQLNFPTVKSGTYEYDREGQGEECISPLPKGDKNVPSMMGKLLRTMSLQKDKGLQQEE